MAWHITDSVEEFDRVAGGFLKARPVENTVALTLVDTLRRRGSHLYGDDDPIFGWFQDDGGEVVGAFLRTPPWPLMLVAAPAVPSLVDLLADHPLPGVNARAGEAEAFADAWRRRTGATARTGRRSRLYRLDTLTPPAPPPGAPRVADAGDRDLLIAWMHEFHAEIGEGGAGDVEAVVDDRLSHDGWALWEVDGSPVSMASVSRVQGGSARVVAVYTPKQWRGRGYAGAVTSVISQAVLDGGADDVVLFTDLANPTSNALYQRLGYRPIEDRTVMEFQQ